jgi:hypothetical protein
VGAAGSLPGRSLRDAQDELAVDRGGLENHVVPLAIRVLKGRADVELIVLLALARDEQKARCAISDGLFGLLYPNETAPYFMLEIDHGTMPVVGDGTPNRRMDCRQLIDT